MVFEESAPADKVAESGARRHFVEQVNHIWPLGICRSFINQAACTE